MEKKRKLSKIDFILLIILVLSYGCLSFFRLGALHNPNTFVTDTVVVLKMEKARPVGAIRYFTGHKMGHVEASISLDGKHFTVLEPIQASVFTWNDIEVGQNTQYIRFQIDSESYIGEIALLDEDFQIMPRKFYTSTTKKVLDEQNMVPKEISYLNSAYFDEIYFARTAYEYAKGLPAYEWVHPPLGKLLMAIPIALFEMSPFYYRFMGNIAGILMIPVFYILAKRMFGKTKYAFLAGILLCMDGFHFAHTRMATVDSFLVLFILLSFLFLYEYFLLKEVSFFSKMLRLGLCALFMSLAICVKWTGLFAAVALAILFFVFFFKNYIHHKKIDQEGKKTIGFCILFFVLFPIFLYLSLYLCFPNMQYYPTRNIKEIFEITLHMYFYHSSLQDPHPFYSSFYTWPLMLRPVWYYVREIGTMKSTISGFGNPVLWWCSTFSLFYLFYRCIRKDRNAFFLLIAYLCLVLPYVRISRGMFLYHYFPALPFAFLALVYLVYKVTERMKNNIFYLFILVLACFFFFYFFPIVSGMKMPIADLEQRKWLSSWHF